MRATIGKPFLERLLRYLCCFPTEVGDLIDRNLKERTVEYRHVRPYELLVRDFILRVAEHQPLRILEVGAGSGDMTWRIAPELKGCQAEYHVSDVSSTFVKSLKSQARREGAGLHAIPCSRYLQKTFLPERI